jgi:hypothetical protein
MGQKISEKQMKEEIRSVVRQNIKEVTTNDWHYKAIMSIWDKGGSFTRKKIAAILCGDPKADRRDVEDALRNSGYDEVTDVTDRLRIEGVIKEEDSIPGGLAKGMTLNDIAEKHGVSVDILVAEFKKGIQTEMEHTTDREMAKEITMDHLFEDPKYYTKLATVEEYVDDKGVEHVAAALPQTEEEPLKEATANANILGIDFNISETDFRIFFAFKDKKEASIKVRQIGSNKIVNLIQNSLDKAYGKGEFFFRSGTNSEIKNGYLFQKKENNIDLNKLKFESIIKEEDYSETPEETLEGLKEMAMGNLERIADYANMISQRMGEGQNLESWMYSQLTIALENLNTVHDAMDGIDGEKEPVKEGKSIITEDMDTIYLSLILVAQAAMLGGNLAMLAGKHIDSKGVFPNIDDVKKWWKDKKDDKAVKSIIAKIKSDPELIAFFKLSQNQQKGKFRKLIATKLSSDEIRYLNRINKSDLQQNESVNENLDNYSKDAITDMIVNLSRYEGNEKLIADLKKILKQRTLGKLKKEQSVNEEKVYIDYLNKQKGFKQDRIKFNSYEEAVKWARKNFEKFNSDMIKYESVNEATESDIIAQIKNIAKTHQNNIIVDPKSGKKMRVDAFSASAIATVYDALSDSNKEKFLASGLLGMQQMAMKLLKK